jgi:predicted house-cleaning NTP pyrophosphatase (Maf/HAM1 superfamily)
MNQHQILHPEIPSSSDEAEPAPTNAAVETSSKRLSAVADLLNPAPVDGTVADTEVVVDKPVFDKAAC